MDPLWLRFFEEQMKSRLIQDLFQAWIRNSDPAELAKLGGPSSVDTDRDYSAYHNPLISPTIVSPSFASPAIVSPDIVSPPIVSPSIVSPPSIITPAIITSNATRSIVPASPRCTPARDSLNAPSRPRSATPPLIDAEMANSEDSGDALTASDSSCSTDDFIEVVGKGKKRTRRAKSQQVPSKSAKTDAASSDDMLASTLTPQPSSFASSAAPAVPTESRPNISVPKKGSSVPPPIFLQEKGKWTEVSTWCSQNHVNFSSARSVKDGIKIIVPTATDFRSLTRMLQERALPYHSFTLPEERVLRVVIKSVPVELSSDDMLKDLRSQGIPALEVHRMYRSRGKLPYEMVLAVTERSAEGKSIFNIKSICQLSGIKVEVPRKTGTVGQCHRCQLYGHSQRNCFARPRCVKCLGEHGTPNCPRPKDRTQCAEPPSCVLCGEMGHPANYRGCPKAPKTVVKRPVARATAPAQKPATATPRLSPQRPTGACWNRETHLRAFPALTSPPKETFPITALQGPSVPHIPLAAFKPAPKPKPALASSSAAALMAPTFSADITASVKNYIEVYETFDFNRIRLMAEAIRANPSPLHAPVIRQQFSDVFAAYKAAAF